MFNDGGVQERVRFVRPATRETMAKAELGASNRDADAGAPGVAPFETVAEEVFNLGNFMGTLALPDAVEQWSLTSLRKKLIKIGAKIVRHGRYVTFQMAEVVIPRDLFADILRRIDRLRPPPAPA